MKQPDWTHRPKGCKKTISGMHTPTYKILPGYEMQIYCSSCGLIDDTGEFALWLFPNSKLNNEKKIDDSKPVLCHT